MARAVFSHSEGGALVHQFRNFGEDVWREFRDERRVKFRSKKLTQALTASSLRQSLQLSAAY